MQDPREVRRSHAAKLGEEAVQISHEGHYTAPSGKVVHLCHDIAAAREATVEYPPQDSVPFAIATAAQTQVRVVNESTLAAARTLSAAGRSVVALNFASARHPGGGFLSGARAQEESLCRSSALYVCIRESAMYAHHSLLRDTMYTSWVIYSPDVPVFRDDDGALLEAPWRCAFITCPAPNVKVLLERDRSRSRELPSVYDDRIARVLSVAAGHGHDAIVLGAWGCGAFGGDAELVAERFHHALRTDFRGVFAEVVFAILDTSRDRRTIDPFLRRFGAR